MGFIKDVKVATIVKEADKATAEGRRLFTPRLNMPGSQATGFTADIADWALIIQGIEDAGWTLVHWAVGNDSKGRAEAYPLFRR